jgi:cullin 1
MDESLLHYYTRQWKKFTAASGYVHHVFSYLNRHWVKREIEEGRKNDVFEVYTVSDILRR